jgi:hypothetical protein
LPNIFSLITAWGYTDGGNVNGYKPRHEKFIEKAVREMEQ